MCERENNMKNFTQSVLLTSAETQLPVEMGLYLWSMRLGIPSSETVLESPHPSSKASAC